MKVRLRPAHPYPDNPKQQANGFAFREALDWSRSVRKGQGEWHAAFDAHPVGAATRRYEKADRAEIAAMKAVLSFSARTDADRKAMGAFILDKVDRGLIDAVDIADIAEGMMVESSI